MTVNKVGYSPVSFGNMYADAKAAYGLATELVGKPALEHKFWQNIVEPLSNTQLYDVFIQSDMVGIMNKAGKGIMSIIQPGHAYDHTLAVVYDYGMHCRNIVRRNSYVIPTENFKNDGYLLRNIEIAKNIIFDREAMAARNATDTYSKIAEETLEQKGDRFEQIFKYNG